MANSLGITTYTLSDGRVFIAAQDVMNSPELRDFVFRFPNYWMPHPSLDGWVSPSDESS